MPHQCVGKRGKTTAKSTAGKTKKWHCVNIVPRCVCAINWAAKHLAELNYNRCIQAGGNVMPSNGMDRIGMKLKRMWQWGGGRGRWKQDITGQDSRLNEGRSLGNWCENICICINSEASGAANKIIKRRAAVGELKKNGAFTCKLCQLSLSGGSSAIKCAMCNSGGLHKYLHVAVLPLTYRVAFAYFNYKCRSSSSSNSSTSSTSSSWSCGTFVIFITKWRSSQRSWRPAFLAAVQWAEQCPFAFARTFDARQHTRPSTCTYIHRYVSNYVSECVYPHFIYTPVIYLCCDFDGFRVRAFWLGRALWATRISCERGPCRRRVYEYRCGMAIISFSFQFSI